MKDSYIIFVWKVDFFDDFDIFDLENWQDQQIWVNNEMYCYVFDGEFGIWEVSDGILKLKVVNIGEKCFCDNLDKYGKQYFDIEFVVGCIILKNCKEFIKGRWIVRLRLWSNGEVSMFFVWWILGV